MLLTKKSIITISLIISGVFTLNLLKAQSPGLIDLSFNTGRQGLVGANDLVSSLALQDDGKIIIGGRFSNYGGKPRGGIARLNADGTLDESFNPGTGFGVEFQYNLVVTAIIIQPDGNILVGGDFNSYNGNNVRGIIRLNSDGSYDESFNPGTGIKTDPEELGPSSPSVRSIAVQPDGKIIIAGHFSHYNLTDRSGIARLESNGNLDSSFDPGTGVSILVNQVLLRDDGKIMIGGYFETYNGANAHDIALLNDDGSLNSSFNSLQGFNIRVNTFAIQHDGKLVVGGDFSTYNGVGCGKIARLNTDGTLDETFNSAPGFQFPITNAFVTDLAIQQDGKVIVVGFFSSYNGDPSSYIVRLNVDGSLDANFSPEVGFNNMPSKLLMQSDQKILVAGDFTSYNGITRERIIRISTGASVDETFNTNDKFHLDSGLSGYQGPIQSMVIQSDNKVIAVGNFAAYQGLSRQGIIRFNEDGSIDTSFDPALNFFRALYTNVVLQPDGKIIVTGQFVSWSGSVSHNLIRLNADGSLDPTLVTGTGFNSVVYSIALQSDGRILVGGYFTTYNGAPVKRMLRLNSNGSIDNTFDVGTGFNQEIECIVVQPDGKIICGGTFTNVNGISRNRIVRLLANGSVDNTFIVGTGFTDRVFALAIQPDGKILVGGTFTNYNGAPGKNIVRLHPNGDNDNTFITGTGFNLAVFTLAITPTEKILVGGVFTSYNETPQGGMAILDKNGTLDVSYNMGTGFDGAIYSILIQPNGKILAGGYFYSYNTVACSHIIRVFGDGLGAPQNIVATPSTNQINLSWDVVPGAILYKIDRSNVDVSNFSPVDTVSTTSFNDGALSPATQYFYRIYTINNEGEASSFTQISARTLRLAQTITLPPFAQKVFGDEPFTIESTASSAGLELNFSSSNPTIASVSTNIITIHGAGAVEIMAEQPGNDLYDAALPVIEWLIIEKAMQNILFEALPEQLSNAGTIALSATCSSGLDVSFESSDEEIVTIIGNVANILKDGTVSITASQSGNQNYFAAENVTRELVINLVLGVKEFHLKNHIFPNPTSDFVFVQISEVGNIEVFDVIGRPRNEITVLENRIDFSKAAAGVYYLKISFKNHSMITRIIKK